MLFLLFQIGNDRYALDASRVVEVVPFLALKKIPRAPSGVAGLFNYRGRPVPAVDLSELAVGRPAEERFSTRIIVIDYPEAAGRQRLLGLIAEGATEMIRKDAKDFVDAGVTVRGASYLGPVMMDKRGVIQWVQEQRLLPDNVREALFTQTAELKS
jgi:chemotaxis-related protein WspB